MNIQRIKRRGAAAIEFAFWMPVLFILLSGLVDLSWYMSRYHLVQRSTMDGVRFGVRQATSEKLTDPQGLLQAPAAELRATTMLTDYGLTGTATAQLIPNGSGCPFDRLEMDVVVPFTPIVGFLPMPASLNATFAMMSEAQR